jgi:hypothetical protein
LAPRSSTRILSTPARANQGLESSSGVPTACGEDGGEGVELGLLRGPQRAGLHGSGMMPRQPPPRGGTVQAWTAARSPASSRGHGGNGLPSER